jgi:hypothetical protein
MHIYQRLWLWLAAAFFLIVGITLIIKQNTAGWLLIILAIVDIVASMNVGEKWAAFHPMLTRWVLIGISFILILVTVIILSVMNLK